jgi:MFS family permease
VLSGLASAGMNLASLDMLLELSPEESRASHAGAYYSILAAATAVAPLLGGWLFAGWGFAGAAWAAGAGGMAGVAILAVLLGRSRS